jgi:hypothetical protein
LGLFVPIFSALVHRLLEGNIMPVISYQLRLASLTVMALILFMGILAWEIASPLIGVTIVLFDFLIATILVLSPGPMTTRAEIAYENANPSWDPGGLTLRDESPVTKS